MGIMGAVLGHGLIGIFAITMAGPQLMAADIDSILLKNSINERRGGNPDLNKDWQWQPIEGSYCRDGSQAGFFVQGRAKSTDLLIYLEGGGACFNNQTCGANPANIDPRQLPEPFGIFSDDERNPVGSWNKVYVPYCTGDVMAGERENVYVSSRFRNEMFVGFRNMRIFLQDWINRFDFAGRILLTGESAGSYGSWYNFEQVQKAFGAVPVYMLGDSGIPFTDEYVPPCIQSLWRRLWNLDATLPAECDACRGPDGGGIAHYIEYLGRKYEGRQFGFISTTEDSIIRIFYGYGNNNCRPIIPLMNAATFRKGLFAVRDQMMSDDFVTYFLEGQEHTFLGERRFFQTQVDGVSLYEWIDQFINQKAISVGR